MADIKRLPGPRLVFYEWQLDAACRGMDSATFYHPAAERNAAREERIARAKEICRSCAAIQECLAHALSVQEPYGIWGGQSEDERATLLGVESLRYPARAKEDTPADHTDVEGREFQHAGSSCASEFRQARP